jgi:hypothetical protein
MSSRRNPVPPTQKHSRSSSSGRKRLIAKEGTEKQSAKERTALDNRFHRTLHSSCQAAGPLSRYERYVACVVSFAGSQSSPFFHSLRATEEIFRASVKSAMSGSTPRSRLSL